MSKPTNSHQQALRHHEAGNLPAAIAAYRKAVKQDPGHAEAWYNLGLALLANNQHTSAEAAFFKATTLQPDLAEAHYNLGLALMHTGPHAAAAAGTGLREDVGAAFSRAASRPH